MSMTKINYVIGDATEPIGEGNKIIAHICNDAGMWSRGFVLAISKKWKEPEKIYRNWFKSCGKLILGQVRFVPVGPEIIVANIIGQHGMYSKNGVQPIRYSAVRDGLWQVGNEAKDRFNASVHMPRIGCGLAGGTWDQIEPIVIQQLCARDISVYVYDLKRRR